jgi:hypothetical protein
MATLAAYETMLERDRKREGLRICRAGWLLGLNVRQYRALEAVDASPDLETYQRIAELFGWPRAYR